MDEILSEERQLMKWVGILQVGISRESWMGGNFKGDFPWGNFPRTYLDIKPRGIRDHDKRLPLIHGQINLIKFIKSNKFDNVHSKI